MQVQVEVLLLGALKAGWVREARRCGHEKQRQLLWRVFGEALLGTVLDLVGVDALDREEQLRILRLEVVG